MRVFGTKTSPPLPTHTRIESAALGTIFNVFSYDAIWPMPHVLLKSSPTYICMYQTLYWVLTYINYNLRTYGPDRCHNITCFMYIFLLLGDLPVGNSLNIFFIFISPPKKTPKNTKKNKNRASNLLFFSLCWSYNLNWWVLPLYLQGKIL